VVVGGGGVGGGGGGGGGVVWEVGGGLVVGESKPKLTTESGRRTAAYTQEVSAPRRNKQGETIEGTKRSS